MSTRYVAHFQRDESGNWLARIPSVRGCHTYGRSLNEARERLREALGLWVDDADTAELEERIGPRSLAAVIASVRRSRRAAESAQERYEQETAEFQKGVRRISKMGISMRDAASLLGISHQRVGQIAGKTRRKSKR